MSIAVKELLARLLAEQLPNPGRGRAIYIRDGVVVIADDYEFIGYIYPGKNGWNIVKGGKNVNVQKDVNYRQIILRLSTDLCNNVYEYESQINHEKNYNRYFPMAAAEMKWTERRRTISRISMAAIAHCDIDFDPALCVFYELENRAFRRKLSVAFIGCKIPFPIRDAIIEG